MWENYFSKKGFLPKIDVNPSVNLGMCVVIPCYNEPNLIKSLGSIACCTLPACDVEVIVVINHPEGADYEVLENSSKAVKDIDKANRLWGSEQLRFHAVKAFNLPLKLAGVGYARQVGMDEAAFRLFTVGTKQGIVACFDADSLCMPNYLTELYGLWIQDPNTHACSIRFEHPLSGDEYPAEVYNGIATYELHLRYYNQASRFIGFPFAYHTVGSSMACSAEAYVKFGGMNRHKAGEDFYFLQKIIPHGHFQELNTTCVYPSPRPSNRVPFGTGRAMSKFIYYREPILTYHLKSFLNLESLFRNIAKLYNYSSNQIVRFIESLAHPLSDYLFQVDGVKAIENVRANASSFKTFKKRFFLWFDAFMLLKYMNFAAENYYGKQPVDEQSKSLLACMGYKPYETLSTRELLLRYREMDNVGWCAKI